MLTWVVPRKIVFYRTTSNHCPVEEFLDELPGKVAQKVTWVLRLIEDMEIVPATYSKKLEGTEIWECRVSFASNTYRMLCFFRDGNTIVLTHGFAKKTERTPYTEIDRANECRKNYLARRT